jgi:hypothetical protein
VIVRIKPFWLLKSRNSAEMALENPYTWNTMFMLRQKNKKEKRSSQLCINIFYRRTIARETSALDFPCHCKKGARAAVVGFNLLKALMFAQKKVGQAPSEWVRERDGKKCGYLRSIYEGSELVYLLPGVDGVEEHRSASRAANSAAPHEIHTLV